MLRYFLASTLLLCACGGEDQGTGGGATPPAPKTDADYVADMMGTWIIQEIGGCILTDYDWGRYPDMLIVREAESVWYWCDTSGTEYLDREEPARVDNCISDRRWTACHDADGDLFTGYILNSAQTQCPFEAIRVDSTTDPDPC